MRHLLALMFLFIFSNAHSQTSLTEYNYITGGSTGGGLKRHFTEGADIKIGYSLQLLQDEEKITWGNGDWRGVTLYYL